jgi:hypothetical protein
VAVSDSDRPRARVDWGTVLTAVVVLGGIIAAFVVVREQGNNNTAQITVLNRSDSEQNIAIQKMREDRSIETKIYDLTLEVRLLRQQVEMSNKDKRR